MRLEQYEYNSNSELTKSFFIDDSTHQLDGECTEYFLGKIIKITTYDQGVKVGTEIEITDNKIILVDYDRGLLVRSRFYQKLDELPSDRGELLEEIRFVNGSINTRLVYNDKCTEITEFNDYETVYKTMDGNSLVKETVVSTNENGVKTHKISSFKNDELNSLIISEGDEESEPVYYFSKEPYRIFSKKLALSVQRFNDNPTTVIEYDKNVYSFNSHDLNMESLDNGFFNDLYIDENSDSFLVTYYIVNNKLDKISVIKNDVVYFAILNNGAFYGMGYYIKNKIKLFDFDFKWYNPNVLISLFRGYDVLKIREIFKNILLGDNNFDTVIRNKIETIKNRINMVESFYNGESPNN